MRKVTRVFVLRQVEVEFKKIQKGDLFCLEIDDNNKKSTTDWSLALANSQEDPHSPKEFMVPSDKVYFIVGKPEISKIVLNQGCQEDVTNMPAERTLQ